MLCYAHRNTAKKNLAPTLRGERLAQAPVAGEGFCQRHGDVLEDAVSGFPAGDTKTREGECFFSGEQL